MPPVQQKQYPTIIKPVGSVAEVSALDPKLLRSVATCSERTPTNMGCHRFDDCQCEWKGGRPEQAGIRLHRADGKLVCRSLHCQEMEDMRIAEEARGGAVEIIAREGETYPLVISQRLHSIPQPLTCQACKEGKCLTYEDATIDHVVKPLRPAAEHPELIRFARANEARQMGATRRKEAKLAEFYGGNQPEAPVEVPSAGSNQPEPVEPSGGAGDPGRRGAGKGPGKAAQP